MKSQLSPARHQNLRTVSQNTFHSHFDELDIVFVSIGVEHIGAKTQIRNLPAEISSHITKIRLGYVPTVVGGCDGCSVVS